MDTGVKLKPFSLTSAKPDGAQLGSKRLWAIFLDEASLCADLASLPRSTFDNFYEKYSMGHWRSLSLMNRDGDASNGQSFEFEGRGRWTAAADQLPYLKRLIEAEFHTDELKSARIFCAEKGGRIVPHRDYMEFSNGFNRLHIPLATNDFCISTEEDISYHMCKSEIWFIDAKRTHAAANYGSLPRYHLVLDFTHRQPASDFIANHRPCTDPLMYCVRSEMPADFEERLRGIAQHMISVASVLRAFYVLCDNHFLYQSSGDDVFGWLLYAAQRSLSRENELAALEIKMDFLGT
jgi:hypothetical protein